jgi:hypothetical protein
LRYRSRRRSSLETTISSFRLSSVVISGPRRIVCSRAWAPRTTYQLFEPLYGLLRAASHTGGHTGETPEGPGASESTLHAEVVQLHAGEFGKMSGEASGKGGIGGVSSASTGYDARERICRLRPVTSMVLPSQPASPRKNDRLGTRYLHRPPRRSPKRSAELDPTPGTVRKAAPKS